MRSARRKISDNYIKYIIWKRRIFLKVDRREVQYIKVKKVAVVISFAWKKKWFLSKYVAFGFKQYHMKIDSICWNSQSLRDIRILIHIM